jgi:hypothetical protein
MSEGYSSSAKWWLFYETDLMGPGQVSIEADPYGVSISQAHGQSKSTGMRMTASLRTEPCTGTLCDKNVDGEREKNKKETLSNRRILRTSMVGERRGGGGEEE